MAAKTNYTFRVQRNKPTPVKTTEQVQAPKVRAALYQLREKLRNESAI